MYFIMDIVCYLSLVGIFLVMSPDRNKPSVVIICGPTGIGKTTVAIEAAKIFNAEILSSDSMQIYRHMDIGTAKPTHEEQAAVPHYMIDIVDPDELFDAEKFAKKAHDKILQLYARGITPFVAGGTGLYIKALIHGLFKAPSSHDARERLKAEAAIHGTGFLYKRLCKCDPDAAEKIHPNDAYRITRALEIYEITGKTISEYHRAHRFLHNRYNVLKVGIYMKRKDLYSRIDKRVDAMIAAGFVDEVEKLMGMGYSRDLKSMRSIGYRHIIDFIRGTLSCEEMLRTLKRDTRRYAKRQMTWFRADSEIVWVEAGRVNEICSLIQKFLQV